MVQQLWKTVWCFFKKLNIELPLNPAISVKGIYLKITENWCSDKYTYVHVHSCSINNIQNMDTAQMAINGWMNKRIVAYTYNRILFSQEKEWCSTESCYDTDETQKRAKRNQKQKVSYCVIWFSWNVQNR